MNIMSMKNKVFEKVIIGETRVVLVGDRYNPEPSEPVYGSKHQCAGIVKIMLSKSNDYDVHIQWDNGKENVYLIKDLRAVQSLDLENPNYTYKRWRRKNEGQ